MKRLLLVAFAVLVSAAPGLAQEHRSKKKRVDNDFQQCVDVEIGGQRLAYNCLNQRMRREVDRTVANPSAAPLDAGSQPNKIGVANPVAVRQQYGPNFGISAVPYRPPTVFSAPLRPGR